MDNNKNKFLKNTQFNFLNEKDKLLDFRRFQEKRTIPDLFKIINENDVVALRKRLNEGVSLNQKNKFGYSLLDIAYMNKNKNTIDLLEQYGARLNLYRNNSANTHKQAIHQLEHDKQDYVIQVVSSNNNVQLYLKHLDSAGKLVSILNIFPWGNSNTVTSEGKWKIFTKDQTCYIVMSKNNTEAQPDLFCEVSSNGSLKLQYANLPGATLQLSTEGDFVFDSIASVKNLAIQAKEIYFPENSKCFNGHTLTLEANRVDLQGNHVFEETIIKTINDFKQSGELVSDLFNLQAESALIFGQIMVPNKAALDLSLRFECEGSLVLGKSGHIKAHILDISRSGQIVVQQGEINLYGASKLENSGSIIGDQVFLNSGMIITNNHGALIKGLSCLLTAPQVNQGGFLLTGQKATLSYLDWGLNFVQAGLKVAELGAYITPPTAISLRGYLLASKTLCRAGDIFYRAMNSEEINNSELVTLILDNVIPCIGSISSHEEQAKVLVNILYQCYGHYQSEEAFIHKSLLAIEAITRLISFSSAGLLTEENLTFLKTAADYIKYSRMGLKAAEISVQAIRGISNNDVNALEKARANFGAMAETAMREYVYALEPMKLFNSNIQLPARDLAIFVMNKGYSSDLFLQTLIFGMLHAAKREGLITSDVDSHIETAIRGLLKTSHWHSLYQAYQEGRLTKRSIANEAISSLLLILSNPVLRDVLTGEQAKLPDVPAETTIESPSEPSVEPSTETQGKEAQTEIVEPESEPEPLSEEELERQKKEKLLIENFYALDDRFKLASTQEERDEINQLMDEIRQEYYKNSKEEIPDRVLIDINIDPLKYVESAFSEKSSTDSENISTGDLLYRSLIEVQKAFNGEYAAHGYLGAFAEAFHNDEVIDTIGNIGIFAGTSGTNTGQIRATHAVSLFGQDLHNRNLDGKVISKKLANLAQSQFKNFESGIVSAPEAISLYCVGLLDNFGVMDSNDEIRLVASRVVKNHKTGKIFAKKDVDMLCDLLADNKGVISGENVRLEGIKEGAVNSGIIYGVDKIRLISEKLASNEVEGGLVSKKVFFESQNINKEGSINAVYVENLGYGQEKPDNTIWKKHEQDSIGTLLLKSNTTDNIEADAFSNVNLLDVTFSKPFEDKMPFNISAEFSNILQLHLPKGDKTIPIWSLPKLADDATLILDAPGHNLDATRLGSAYNSHFRFTGNEVYYSGGNTRFEQTASFAVDKMIGLGASSEFYIKNGGYVQAESMLNQGYFHSDGIINWSLGKLDNDVILEHYIQQFVHSKHNPHIDNCESTRVIKNSGKIYALGHQGHLGIFNQYGGTFLSGEKGTYVYHSGGHQKAILIHEGRKTSEILEDGGQNWHSMPIWHEAKIGGTGRNYVIGKQMLMADGLDFYGDKGAFLYAEQGIKQTVQSAPYHIPATESRTKSGKFEHFVHQDERGEIKSQNHMSSKVGELRIVAPEGGVHLENTIISSEKDAFIIARDKVIIEGVESEVHTKYKERRRKLWHHKSIKSDTDENKVDYSYVFCNQTLTICCEELIFDAVQANILGDFNILAKKTTFDGKQQTFSNTTKTKEFRLSMPAADNLKSILKGHNAQVIFGNLMRSFGWNDQELQNILHARSVGELPSAVIHFARDTYNLTSFVAHACNELGQSPTDFVGAVTDKWGLTTLTEKNERIVDPRFSFKFTKTTERTQASQSVATHVTVGGTFRMVGNTLHLLEGSTVDAEHLRIFLTEGIKATFGTEKFMYSKDEKSVSLGVSALTPQDVSVGLDLHKESKRDETHHLAKLHARGTTEINAGEGIQGALQIHGEGGGRVTAAKMDFESTQDTHFTKTLDASVSASTTGSSAGASMQKGKTEEYITTEKAGILLKGGTVNTNHLNLQGGSKVETGLLRRADGKEGLPTVTGTEAKDSKTAKSSGFGLKVQPDQGLNGSPSIGGNYSSEKKETLHRPTVIADNVTEEALPGINTDATKETEVITNKRKAFILPDTQELKEGIGIITEQGGKALNFMFKAPTPQTKSANEVKAPEMLIEQEDKTTSSLNADNVYIKKALDGQIDELFSKTLNLGKSENKDLDDEDSQTNAKVDKPKKPKNVMPNVTEHEVKNNHAGLSSNELNLFLNGNLPEKKIIGNLPTEMMTNLLNTEIKPSAVYGNSNPDVLTTIAVASTHTVLRTGQGIKQLYFALGESVDLIEEGKTAKYTHQINEEQRAYQQTAIGQSKLGKTTEFATNLAIGLALPISRVGKLGGVLLEGAVGEMIQSGLAPTEDGKLLSNLEKAAKGTLQGAGETALLGEALKRVEKAKKILTSPASTSLDFGAAANEVIPQPVLFSNTAKASAGSKPVAPHSNFNAANVNAQAALNKKLSALEEAQSNAVKIQNLPDGRIRYFEAERPATTPGPTRGSSYFTEYTPATGLVKSFNANYDHAGNINRVQPLMINGQQVQAPSYAQSQVKNSKGPK